MDGTCVKNDCPLWKKHKEKCPNFIMTGWQSANGGQTKTVEDCAPKRTMLMVQELYNRLIAVEKVVEEQRNEGGRINKTFAQLFERAQEFKQIEGSI